MGANGGVATGILLLAGNAGGLIVAVIVDMAVNTRGNSDGAARAWLFGIAANLLNGYLRRGYAERTMVRKLKIDVPTLSDESERVLDLDAVVRVRPLIDRELQRLPTEQREAVHLRVVDELAFAAIAERQGISEPAARMRVSRGLVGVRGTRIIITYPAPARRGRR